MDLQTLLDYELCVLNLTNSLQFWDVLWAFNQVFQYLTVLILNSRRKEKTQGKVKSIKTYCWLKENETQFYLIIEQIAIRTTLRLTRQIEGLFGTVAYIPIIPLQDTLTSFFRDVIIGVCVLIMRSSTCLLGYFCAIYKKRDHCKSICMTYIFPSSVVTEFQKNEFKGKDVLSNLGIKVCFFSWSSAIGVILPGLSASPAFDLYYVSSISCISQTQTI